MAADWVRPHSNLSSHVNREVNREVRERCMNEAIEWERGQSLAGKANTILVARTPENFS